MKNLRFVVLSILILIPTLACSKEPYHAVYDAWYNTSMYPEKGNQFIYSNQAVFNNRFHVCLNSVEKLTKYLSMQYIAGCNQKIDPREANICLQGNEAGKFVNWTQEIRQVVLGKVRWSETMIGQASMLAKNTLGTETYETLISSSAPWARQQLVCQ